MSYRVLVEGFWDPPLYDIYASKDRLSREWLEANGMALEKIENIPNGEAFKRLVEFSSNSASEMTDVLYKRIISGMAWYIIATVGAVSAKWVFRLQKKVDSECSCVTLTFV